MKKTAFLFLILFSLQAFSELQQKLQPKSLCGTPDDIIRKSSAVGLEAVGKAWSTLYSLREIRNTVNQNREGGLCLSGLPISESIQQHGRFLFLLEWKSDLGLHRLPMVFQSAPVQALHNAKHTRWYGLPYENFAAAAQNLAAQIQTQKLNCAAGLEFPQHKDAKAGTRSTLRLLPRIWMASELRYVGYSAVSAQGHIYLERTPGQFCGGEVGMVTASSLFEFFTELETIREEKNPHLQDFDSIVVETRRISVVK